MNEETRAEKDTQIELIAGYLEGCDNPQDARRVRALLSERDELRNKLAQAEFDENSVLRLNITRLITIIKDIIEDAEHAEDCPLYGIRSAPLVDMLHICNCFKQRALKVTG